MDTYVELHLIQNFAPNNLNRDQTGAPKTCEFGGHRRARISSQCLKRAIAWDPGFVDFLDGRGAVRTRRLIVEVAERIDGTTPASDATVKLVSEVFAAAGIERPQDKNEQEKEHTRILLYLDREAFDQMAASFRARWNELTGGSKEARASTMTDVGRILAGAVKAPNLALFGRMVELKADSPFGKLYLDVDAACQVAHAISTNRMNIEFDFYTAVDDLLPQEDSGAGMMGDVQFASACMYRYANVNMRQLTENLGGNTTLARQTLRAFLEAAIRAIPSGHQNSMAAHNLPSFVLAVARRRPASLQNAFAKPVRPDETMDLVDASVKALDTYWGHVSRMFGTRDIGGAWCCALNEEVITHLTPALVPSVDKVIGNVVATATQVAQVEAMPLQDEVVV